MVYGTIQDFYTAVKGTENSVVKFLVKSEDEETTTTCTVCAEIPNNALEFDMVKAGSAIGWEEPKVYIEIEGVDEVPFKKIGKCKNDEAVFYEHLKSLNKLAERRA